MLRIISGLVLLIISQFSFASVSTSNQVIAASVSTSPAASGYDKCVSFFNSFNPAANNLNMLWDGGYGNCYVRTASGYVWKSANYSVYSCSSGTLSGSSCLTYSCSSGTLSDASGNSSTSGQYCNTQVITDSCFSLKGQKFYAYTLADTTSNVCEGTCDASFGSASFAPTDKYQEASYIYTGTTDGCTTDTPTVDAATAQAANLKAKIDDEITKAETACGGIGYYTTGQVNGATTVVCTNQTPVTSSATSTTTSGATSTTNTTSTTTNNSGQSTTVNPDGTSSTSGGTTNSSGSTSTTTTKTNPDGSTTTTTTASGATGTCEESDMQGTAGCAQLGDPSSLDSTALGTDSVQFGFGSGAAWGSTDSSCPSNLPLHGTVLGFSVPCDFFRMMRPFFLAICSLIAVYITFGIRRGGED